MRQTETSRTLVFDDDVHARAFFEARYGIRRSAGIPPLWCHFASLIPAPVSLVDLHTQAVWICLPG